MYKDGRSLEEQTLLLVKMMGFRATTTKKTHDGGIDIIAFSDDPIIKGKYIIQCKDYSGPVGEPPIRDLYGVVQSERANKGILITTSTFTKAARDFASGKPIELIDGNQFKKLLSQYGIEEFIESEINIELDEDKFNKGMIRLLGFKTNSKDEEQNWRDFILSFGKLKIDKDLFIWESEDGSANIIALRPNGYLITEIGWIPDLRDVEIEIPTPIPEKNVIFKIKYEHQLTKDYCLLYFEGDAIEAHDDFSKIFRKAQEQKINNSNCFVATAVYEDNNCWQVESLRRWRDLRLSNNLVGRCFIKLY